MSSGLDDRHVLRVRDGDAEVIHPDDCPTEMYEGMNGQTWPDRTCAVGREITHAGYDTLTDENGNDVDVDALSDGDYPLALSWYTPESMFEDADSEFTIQLTRSAT